MVAESSISFDGLADTYDATRGGLARGRSIAVDVESWIERGPVLEVGVGTGAVALALEDMGWHPVGVDLSPRMLCVAHERLGPRVTVGDAQELPIARASVGSLLLVWVLQLVGDVDEVLAETRRVLKPGGRAVAVLGPPIFPADDEIRSLVDGLLESLRRPGSWPAQVRASAITAGLSPIAEGLTTEVRWRQSPNDEADRIEQRSFGMLQGLDEATFERLTRPVVEGLRSLPDPDRPRQRASRHAYLVLEPLRGGSS